MGWRLVTCIGLRMSASLTPSSTQRRGDHFCSTERRSHAKFVCRSCNGWHVPLFRQVFRLAKVECAHHDRSTGAETDFEPGGPPAVCRAAL
jgi:hypothetical protein